MGRRKNRSSGRNRRRSGYTLDAKLTGASSTRMMGYRIGAVVLLLVTLGGTAYAAYRGGVYVRDLAFARNPRYTIEAIHIEEGDIKTADMIREYLAYKGIAKGVNLFAFQMDAFRNEYLAYNPVVRDMTIRRRLPGTLEVSITERQPAVRLGQRETLVCDREGVVFRLGSGLHELPVIIGNMDPRLMPGQRVEGMTRTALEVFRACEDPRLGLQVLGIDIRNRDYLLLHVVSPSGIKEVKLAWEGMDGPPSEASRAAMVQQLRRVRQTSLLEDRPDLDATFPDRVFGG